jgi:hypothetical protein
MIHRSFKRVLTLAGAASAGVAFAATAFAGPNAGGVLLLHAAPKIEYTTSRVSYCDSLDLPDWEGIRVRSEPDPDRAQLFYVLAVFDTSRSPRLQTVTFGLGDYGGEGTILFENWGSCLHATEITTEGWPRPNGGTALSFVGHHFTEAVTPLYWFSAYVYVAGELPLGPHPSEKIGGNFIDDSPVQDPIEAYGVLGFGVEGTKPPPRPLVPLRKGMTREK